MANQLSVKRKLQSENDLEPAAKIPRLSDDAHTSGFLKLPPKILLHIFDYLKPEDDRMKELSQVCKLFKDICSPRLRVLRLEFNKIIASKCYPIIIRAYTEIRMTGGEIDCNCADIGKVLASSRKTARKLCIKAAPWNMIQPCQIKMRTLMFILRSLPNLEEVELVCVEGLMPQISTKAIRTSEHLKLEFLSKLTMKHVYVRTLLAFEAADNITEVDLCLTGMRIQSEQDFFDRIVGKKTKLQKFRCDFMLSGHKPLTSSFKNLRVFNAAIQVESIANLLNKI